MIILVTNNSVGILFFITNAHFSVVISSKKHSVFGIFISSVGLTRNKNSFLQIQTYPRVLLQDNIGLAVQSNKSSVCLVTSCAMLYIF